MYNLWWIVIGLGIAIIVFIILCIKLHGECSVFSDLPTVFYCITTTIGIAFILVLAFAIGNPIVAKNEYNEFLETKALVEQVYQGNYEQYENAGLNVKIIEVNQWLAKAKSQKKQWGNWSMYCNVDVENLDYIVLGGVQQ